MKPPAQIAEFFAPDGKVLNIREYGNGNINRTFLVTAEAKPEERFILQRINTQVFRRPELIMRNMRTLSDHVSRRLERDDARKTVKRTRRWEMPRVLMSREGKDHVIDSEGAFWRAITFIDQARSFETIKSPEHAREVGGALGVFHNLLSDLPSDKLADTLEGFHVTPLYLRHYERVLSAKNLPRDSWVQFGLDFVQDRRAWAPVLENAREAGKLTLRPIHGDPKVNNIMIGTADDKAIGMVDLDTIKPGLIHYDVGDCLRSCCNSSGEETTDLDGIRFDTDLCRAVLDGYFSEAREFFTSGDYDYLYESIRLIAFELGLRFFTDHLEGNVYFTARHHRHNLDRAMVQFKLCESIERQEKAIRSIIQELR